ncbi:putative SNAP25 homologous protein SNAP30 [Bienertia sinuspersici]
MFGFKKKNAASPAHSDADSGLRSRRTSSEPIPATEDLENRSTQELETYAVNKAEETTKSVNNCLKIAEDIREDASNTLETLHQQGEQIHRTHQMAVNIDQDLSKGEKLLNSLGGMFSKPWKPKKAHNIKGPSSTPDEPSKSATKEQKDKLKGAPPPKGTKPSSNSSKTPPSDQSAAMQKVELEKQKQDVGISDLSNILGDLKGMAVDMGSELDRQNKALDHLDTDIDELNSRVKGANQRARHLLNK